MAGSVILAGARTPIGKLSGALAGFSAAELGGLAIKEALVRALPDIPDQELTWRMHFMFGALSYTMAGNDALKLIATCKLEGVDDPEAINRRLVPFLAAGLRAPLPQVQHKRGALARKIGSVSGRKAA